MMLIRNKNYYFFILSHHILKISKHPSTIRLPQSNFYSTPSIIKKEEMVYGNNQSIMNTPFRREEDNFSIISSDELLNPFAQKQIDKHAEEEISLNIISLSEAKEMLRHEKRTLKRSHSLSPQSEDFSFKCRIDKIDTNIKVEDSMECTSIHTDHRFKEKIITNEKKGKIKKDNPIDEIADPFQVDDKPFWFYRDQDFKHIIQEAKSILVPVRFNPIVYVAKTVEESDLACHLLMEDSNFPFLSFDTETTVTRKCHPSTPSVIQLSNFKICVIFQIYRMTLWTSNNDKNNSSSNKTKKTVPLNFPIKLKQILESSEIVKYGLCAQMDASVLDRFYQLQCRSVFDLSPFCKALNLPQSLAKFASLYANSVYHDKETDRRQIWRDHLKRMWERPKLKNEEIDYASRDVFAVTSALQRFIRESHSDVLSLEPSRKTIEWKNELIKSPTK